VQETWHLMKMPSEFLDAALGPAVNSEIPYLQPPNDSEDEQTVTMAKQQNFSIYNLNPFHLR